MIDRIEPSDDLELLVTNDAENAPDDTDEVDAVARPDRGTRAIDLYVDLDADFGPAARFLDRDGGRDLLLSAENRVYLVYFLADALRRDRARGMRGPEVGWRSNDQASVAVWGRRGLTEPRRLKSLVFNTRSELRAAGLDPWCLDKRRGGIRLDVGRVWFGVSPTLGRMGGRPLRAE